MPRFRATVMNPDLPWVRVVDKRGRPMDGVIAFDTDLDQMWRYQLDPGGKLPLPNPDGRMPREVVKGGFRVQFREPSDLPDDQVDWLPWSSGDRPPYKTMPEDVVFPDDARGGAP